MTSGPDDDVLAERMRRGDRGAFALYRLAIILSLIQPLRRGSAIEHIGRASR
jgi:hypothetical protein